MILYYSQFSPIYMIETTNFQAKKSNDGISIPQKDYLDHQEVLDIENDFYDPTPYYLYDDTNGEPPLSWEERQRLEDSKFREQYGWA